VRIVYASGFNTDNLIALAHTYYMIGDKLTISDWAALTSVIAAAGGATAIGIKWTIKHYLAELKPNGGSSMRDAINRIGLDVTEMRVSLARLEGRFDQHVEEGEK
jgi:hypothetical protein